MVNIKGGRREVSRESVFDMQAFDIGGELPGPGVTLLEASAGTGKTYAIAALVTRYVAEGVPIGQFLVITFTIAATSELRDRVRRRIEHAEAALTTFLATGESDASDPLLAVLTAGDCVELSRDRLAHALANFDAATIATTHGFCLDALAGLGLAGDSELNPTFAPDVSGLIDQVLADEYVRRFRDVKTSLPESTARELVKAVSKNLDATIEPRSEPGASGEVSDRVELALGARSEFTRRKRRASIATYDDLVTRLHSAVDDPHRGARASAALQDRYRVVLVDEFQDTDNLQWAALNTAFGHGRTTLLLIGDPKQAIYAFRGADIYAYLAASHSASSKRTLTRNFRSDARLLAALDVLFGEVQLGDPLIRYRPVSAGDPMNTGDATRPSLRLRGVGATAPIQHIKDGFQKDSANQYIARDLAADVVAKLDAGHCQPHDIAVLVGKHAEASLIQERLEAVGVPGVIRANRSVLATPGAQAWLWLLDALDRPSSAGAARRLASSSFLGWSAQRIATAEDGDWAGLHRQISAWSDVLAEHGVAALLDTVGRSTELLSRLLARPRGERDLTDLQHIGELVNEQSVQTHHGAGALAAWLRDKVTEALVSEDDERARRLDSDAEAVQVITIHAAKGLEFEIVYCPFLWHPPFVPKSPAAPVYHQAGSRVIHVGGAQSKTYAAAKQSEVDERLGESLRLAYVALTRARHELILWWAPGFDGDKSPLTRILRESGHAGSSILDTLAALARETDTISLDVVNGVPSTARWSASSIRPAGVLSVNELARPIDLSWRRSSFSALTSRAHEARVGSEPSGWHTTDEVDLDAVFVAAADIDEELLRATLLPLATMPAGAAAGTFVHSILEAVDFTASDLRATLATEITRQSAWRPTGSFNGEQISAGLAASIETPLGTGVAGVRLRDLGVGTRINEMGFEYSVCADADQRTGLTVDSIHSLLDSHLVPDDPLRGYLNWLDDSELSTTLRGYLLGSLDLVFRTVDQAGVQRFSIADYKTNRLGPADELSAWHYRPEALREAVFDAHYPLQFLIYTVALHRYLRWRLPDYDPALNLGPTKYLFVRGMIGRETPVVGADVCGVFSWQAPPDLVCALSDLMANGVRT